MRYKIKRLEIRSENAAKSMRQPSKRLVAWLSTMPSVGSALDYGCGKLRYAHQLAEKCASLTLVDSACQINRLQTIGAHRTTVADYVKEHLPSARVLTVAELRSDRRKYGFALCSNVLSAIPSARARADALSAIRNSLTHQGRCLFTSHYRNTYFSRISKSPRAKPHLDGWLVTGPRGAAFYGILPRDALEKLLVRNGFAVVDSWIGGESAYCLASRRPDC